MTFTDRLYYLLITGTLLHLGASIHAAERPNIVVIMTDDKSDDLVGSAIGSARNTENRRY